MNKPVDPYQSPYHSPEAKLSKHEHAPRFLSVASRSALLTNIAMGLLLMAILIFRNTPDLFTLGFIVFALVYFSVSTLVTFTFCTTYGYLIFFLVKQVKRAKLGITLMGGIAPGALFFVVTHFATHPPIAHTLWSLLISSYGITTSAIFYRMMREQLNINPHTGVNSIQNPA